MSLHLRPYGDSALLVTAQGGQTGQRWETVHRLAAALKAAGLGGVEDAIATYDSLLIEFDCTVTGHDAIERWIGGWNGSARDAQAPRPRRFLVPTVYGGPDLPDVADQLGLTTDQVVSAHSGADWVVRFLGAPVGAPMLDGSSFGTPVSRRPEPRTAVPPGSVAVAGLQGVVYPVLSPGGWQLIGRTPLRLVDVERRPLVAYRPGDVLSFVPITADQWDEHAGDLAACDG